jgi:hypothetical protein
LVLIFRLDYFEEVGARYLSFGHIKHHTGIVSQSHSCKHNSEYTDEYVLRIDVLDLFSQHCREIKHHAVYEKRNGLRHALKESIREGRLNCNLIWCLELLVEGADQSCCIAKGLDCSNAADCIADLISSLGICFVSLACELLHSSHVDRIGDDQEWSKPYDYECQSPVIVEGKGESRS